MFLPRKSSSKSNFKSQNPGSFQAYQAINNVSGPTIPLNQAPGTIFNPNLPPQGNMNPGQFPAQLPGFKKPKNYKLYFILTSVLSLLTLSTAGFLGYLFYDTNNSLTSAKKNVDTLAASKAQDLLAPLKAKLENDYIEKDKEPYRSYSSPKEFGTVKLQFPKYWSSYVVGSSSTTSIDFYAHPYDVPAQVATTRYALRMKIENNDLANYSKNFDSRLKAGKVKSEVYTANGAVGTKFTGLITDQIEGTLVAFPIRDKLVTVWTEGKDFQADFDKAVIPGLTFIP